MTVPPTARNAKRELKKTGHLLDPVRRGRRDAAAVSATAAGHAQGLRSHARRCLGLSSAATTALSFRRTALTRRAAIPTAPSPEPLGGLCTRRRSQAGRGATAGYVCAPTPTAARAPSAGTPRWLRVPCSANAPLRARGVNTSPLAAGHGREDIPRSSSPCCHACLLQQRRSKAIAMAQQPKQQPRAALPPASWPTKRSPFGLPRPCTRGGPL